jgi:hypothetical protein
MKKILLLLTAVVGLLTELTLKISIAGRVKARKIVSALPT